MGLIVSAVVEHLGADRGDFVVSGADLALDIEGTAGAQNGGSAHIGSGHIIITHCQHLGAFRRNVALFAILHLVPVLTLGVAVQAGDGHALAHLHGTDQAGAIVHLGTAGGGVDTGLCLDGHIQVGRVEIAAFCIGLQAEVQNAFKLSPGIVVVGKFLNGAGNGCALGIVLAVEGRCKALAEVDNAIQNGMDQQGVAILAACSGIGALEAHHQVIHIPGAVVCNGVECAFQVIICGRVRTDTITAGGIIQHAVIVVLRIAVVADHGAGDTQQVQLPVDHGAAIAMQRRHTGIAQGLLV